MVAGQCMGTVSIYGWRLAHLQRLQSGSFPKQIGMAENSSALLPLALGVCDDWQHADIQLDLSQANWQLGKPFGETCIHGQQNHESALQAGRVAVDFLSLPMALTVKLFHHKGKEMNPVTR